MHLGQGFRRIRRLEVQEQRKHSFSFSLSSATVGSSAFLLSVWPGDTNGPQGLAGRQGYACPSPQHTGGACSNSSHLLASPAVLRRIARAREVPAVPTSGPTAAPRAPQVGSGGLGLHSV